jgi:hypothetical protein
VGVLRSQRGSGQHVASIAYEMPLPRYPMGGAPRRQRASSPAPSWDA